MELVGFFDGAAEPNPGLPTFGWLVYREPDHVLLADGQGVVKWPAVQQLRTNNVAEYSALGHLLKWVADHLSELPGLTRLVCKGDSQLVVRQMKGEWACNKPHLQDLRDRCRTLARRIEVGGCEVGIEWIGREFNQEADRRSVAAWESETGRPFPDTSWRRKGSRR